MSGDSEPNTGEMLEIPVGEIGPGPLVRSDRLDLDHVARLRPVIDLCPPVLIRETGKGWSLVDGAHRLAANKDEGRETIRAVVRAMEDAEALEAAIEANIAHGLTLSATERKAAAKLLVGTTKYGDARIAQICGIGAGTVADLRPKCPGPDLDTRTGVDGKDYPSPAVAKLQRERAEAAYAANPSLSVRKLAEVANCSKGIAEAVIAKAKDRQPEAPALPAGTSPGPVVSPSADGDRAEADPGEGSPPAPGKRRGVDPPVSDGPPAVGDVIDHCPTPGQWVKQPGMADSNAARATAQYFDKRLPRTDDSPAAIAANVPAPLRDQAAFAARLAIEFWTAVAADLSAPARLTSVEEA